jgi:hypothetical protein
MTTTTFAAHQAANQRRRDAIGQFATESHLEADVALLDPSATSHADEAIKELSGAELMAAARASVRTHAFNKGVRFVGEDDMVQETLEAVLQYKAKNGQIVITRPYVHAVGAGIVAHAARGRLRAEDRKAIGIFTARVDELEREFDRRLTGAEKDEVAARIRDRWEDPRHRPSTDFVALAEIQTLSLSAPMLMPKESWSGGHGGASTLLDIISESDGFSTTLSPDDDGLSVEPGSDAARVLSGEETSQVKNRNGVWDMYASLTGIPTAAPSRLSPRGASAAKVAIAQAGGATEAAKTWLSGETSQATDALFSPFGALDDQGRDDVAGALVQRPAYAEEMWASAVSTSTRKPR